MTSRILSPFQSAGESSPEDETTIEAPEETAPMPGWNPGPSPRPRPQDPIDERATVLDPEEDDDAGDASGPSSGGASSPAFTDNLASLAERVTIGTAVVGTLLAAGSGVLNDRLGDGPEDPTWLMDEQELAAIATPLGRIGARRVPMPGGSEASDIADLVTAGAGLIGYLLRNLQERSMRRRSLRGYGLPAQAPEQAPAAEPAAAAEPERDVTTSLITNRPTGGAWGL